MYEKDMILAGNILLNSYGFDWEEFCGQFHDDWNMEIEGTYDEFTCQFAIGEVNVACMYAPAPKAGAVEAAANNTIWTNAKEMTATHVAHVEVGIMDCPDPLRRHVLYTMVASSMLKQENTIGLFRYPTVHEKHDFIAGAETLKQDEFPVSLWVYVGYYKNANGLWSSYTYGMEDFGRAEMEILNTDKTAYEMFLFMAQLVKFLITEGQDLEGSSAISDEKGNSYAITMSEAVAYIPPAPKETQYSKSLRISYNL